MPRFLSIDSKSSLTQLSGTRLLAAALVVLAAAYLAWKVAQSGDQALQFAFNGLAVGAVYAIMAMGFTLVYSTVWFFDLYYGAAAALGAYGVFYLRSNQAVGGQYGIDSLYLNIVLAVVVAGVAAWALHVAPKPRVLARLSPGTRRSGEWALAAGAGAYTGLALTFHEHLYLILSPAVGLTVAVLVAGAFGGVRRRLPSWAQPAALPAGAVAAGVAGAWAGYSLANTPGANLYVSWGVSCLLAGAVGLALYRGLYAYMRERARSPLVMLVASLGILLAVTAAITIVFQAAPRALPEAFGSTPWTIAGANIKGFNLFAIGVALAAFVGLLLLLKLTAFGKAVRAIGDDEEVSRIVGIDTRTVIAIVFFIGAVYAALAGVLSGHDTAIQPKMGLLLLLKGWIASVVGGMGNLYGAILGGFALGMVEQFGIWDLAGEWKDAISFVLLILFLSFWPRGILPRK